VQEAADLLAQSLGRHRECRVPGIADGVIAEGEEQVIILDWRKVATCEHHEPLERNGRGDR
jgi:hypothetical protein